MEVFLTQRIDNDEEFRAQLVRVESELTATRKATTNRDKLLKKSEEAKQATKVEARHMGKEKEVAKAKCKDVEQERD